MIATLNPTAKKNAIFEGDFFALFCAFLAWGHEMSDAVVIYTNDAVRDALIACHAANTLARKILVAALGLECEKQLAPWYARVTTDSNLADGPSRLQLERVLQLELLALAYYKKWGKTRPSKLSHVSKRCE